MSQTGDKPSGKVGPPDLQYIVLPLSHGVQEAMALLYRLQKNSLDLALRNKGLRISYDSLVKSRDIFRADWRSYIDLLQRCHTYVRDFTLLCEYATTRPASECSAFSRGMLDMGKKIHEEASRMQAKHQRTYYELRAYTSPGVMRTPSGKMDEKSLIYQELRGAGDVHLSLAQFIQNAEVSIRPNDDKALSTIQDALRMIETSLRDLGVFWKNQVDELTSANATSDFRLSTERPADLISRWRRYDAVIVGSISSILESLDAVVVQGSSKLEETRDENQRRRRLNTIAYPFLEEAPQMPREPLEGRQGRVLPRTKSTPTPSARPPVRERRKSQRTPETGEELREELRGMIAKQTAEVPQQAKEGRAQTHEGNTKGQEKARIISEAGREDSGRNLKESEGPEDSRAHKSGCGCIIM